MIKIQKYSAQFVVQSGKGRIRLYLENGQTVPFPELSMTKFSSILAILDTEADMWWDGVTIQLREWV